MAQGLSMCAAKYAKALSDPWSAEANGACIPKVPSRPSQKLRLFTRFVVTISEATGGTIPIYFTPTLGKGSPVALVGQTQSAAALATSPNPLTVFASRLSTAAGAATINTTSGSATVTLQTVNGLVSTGSSITGNFGVSSASKTSKLVALISGVDGKAGAVYTMDSAAGTTTSNINAVVSNPGGFTPQYINSPYETNQFADSLNGGSSVQGRLVSFGASVQYTGTVLNMGGLYYQFVSASHTNMNQLSTTANFLGSQDETLVDRITSKKQWFATGSIDDIETSYTGPYSTEVNSFGLPTNNLYPYSQGYSLSDSINQQISTGQAELNAIAPGGIGGAPMVVLIQSPGPATFEVEIVEHVEFIGASTAAFHTPTHSDSRGFEIVNTAVQKLPSLRVSQPNASPPKLMASSILETIRELSPAINAGAKMLGNYFSSASMNHNLSRLRLMN